MVRSGGITKMPKNQKSHYLIGPSSSWLLPSNSDLWTQPKSEASLSYFIYGSSGCFNYGEVYHHVQSSNETIPIGHTRASKRELSAVLNRLIDVDEDKSRVICTRFLKTSTRPVAMILTENGSLLIHDCITSENLVALKRSELIARLSENDNTSPSDSESSVSAEPPNKRQRYDNINQFVSIAWPHEEHVFLASHSDKQKLNQVFWLRLKNLSSIQEGCNQKSGVIESVVNLNLGDNHQYSPIKCMECMMIPDSKTCILAVAMEDGLITVLNVNLNHEQSKRIINLERHREQICSLSLYFEPSSKFHLGLLASVSRDGMLVVWDIENEYYFAYYTVQSDSCKINWFACKFVPSDSPDNICLAMSNPSSELTSFNIPKERPKSIIKLQGSKPAPRSKNGANFLRHHALIFNIASDHVNRFFMTTSLDGNLIFWTCDKDRNDKNQPPIETRPRFVLATIRDGSRTHMLRFSNIRFDLLGLALQGGGVRFYTLKEEFKDCCYDMDSCCRQLAKKLTKKGSQTAYSPTSLAWHPNNEYRLAIGTVEGKILRVDIIPGRPLIFEATSKSLKSKPPVPDNNSADRSDLADYLFDVEYNTLDHEDEPDGSVDNSNDEASKGGGIYSLCWGPNPSCPEDMSRYAIYAVSSKTNRLGIYENYSKTKSDGKECITDYLCEFIDQSLPEAMGQASVVDWTSGMDLMALGTTDGRIIIVNYLPESHADRSKGNLFKKLAVVEGPFGDAKIQCLSWHVTRDQNSPYYYCLAASASQEPAAYLFDISECMLVTDVKNRLWLDRRPASDEETFGVGGEGTGRPHVISSYVYKLEGHTKGLSDISWNPHSQLQLATSSFDRSCIIWSIDEGSRRVNIASKFYGRHRLFTVEWSSADLIFTSGQDGVVWAWRPSMNRCHS